MYISTSEQSCTLPTKYAFEIFSSFYVLLRSSTRKKKTLGMEIKRTPDEKLRFVGFIRFVGFNFGQVQL